MRNAIIVILLLLSTGCSLQQHSNNQLANQLLHEKPEKILSILQEKTPNERDSAQYHLNLGYLQLLSGEFIPAIESLTQAKQTMQSLDATSITENIGAGTVNETLRSYSGYPSDKVMVHNMLALSYLFNQDIEGARVEMLQADVAMKKLVEDKLPIGQLASTHLLSAIVYELLDERSNSFISYQLAEEILIEREMPVPEGIKFALLRMSKKMGNDQAYSKLSKKYPQSIPKNDSGKQIFSLYFDGVVSNKVEESLTVPSFSGRQIIRISMPAYPVVHYNLQRIKISDDIQNVSSEVIENIENLAREDLAHDYPEILLATTTRATVKYAAVKAADKKDPLLGAVFNILSVISEVADLRSWNMLPSTIQFSYLQSNSNNIVISSLNSQDNNLDISEANQHIILSTSLSNNLFHYQQ